MAIPLHVPAPQHHPRFIMSGHSPKSSAQHGLYSPFSSSTSLPSQYTNSCALTILKGHAEHPINAHAPIHHKHNPSKASKASTAPSHPSRFAASFTSLRSASKALPTGFDSSVNVHTLSDHGILLPFLDRPSEVKELIFDTKANEALMYRLCRVFGGNPDRPLLRGQDERWDEMLELLIELDRPLLDDEDWLVRLESLVMERSPELWAQLARCLGAEGLTLRSLGQPSSFRFDSWALSSQYSRPACDNDSPLSAVSSQDDQGAARDQQSLSVSVEPLEELPPSYSEQPAGKLQNSTLREAASPSLSPSPSPSFLAPDFASRSSDTLGSQASFKGDLFPMSAGGGGEDSAMTGSLEDIMEEPSSNTDANPPSALRRRSQSGKFAGLRISALSSSSPPASRRTSTASDTLSAAGRWESSGSPLPTGAMSPASLVPMSPVVSPSPDTSTSFSKHRRLSTMIKHNNITHPQQEQQQQQHHHHHHHHHRRSSDFDMDASASPKFPVSHRRRGVSEAGHSVCAHSSDSKPRRRAESFARSFAELKSPSEHLEQLRAEHAKVEADRLAEHTRRISLKDTASASAPAAPTTCGLGLHRDCAGSSLLDPSSTSLMGAKAQRPSIGRICVGSVGSRGAASSTGSTSPPIPGLLPDGRTRHPSGSCGSRDLSESIAAFRATMGLSISPSPSERHYFNADDGCSDAGKSTDSATRKRKGSGGAELPKPTSKTADTAEAKILRKASSTNTEEQQKAQFEQPKHMQELESRNKASGASGSGLALGGGFSLAKSGANFRRQSHDSTPCTQSVWRSSFARRDVTRTRGGEPYSYRPPPAVHRRPGGFVSLAQEYERARHGRRASESVFSIHSNALDSSPSSSIAGSDIAGFDGATGARNHRRSSEEPVPRLELLLAGHSHGDEGKMSKSATTPDIVKGDPTPKAGPATSGGGITPRASFASCSTHLAGDQQQGYPFPKLLSRVAAPLASEDVKMEAAAARGKDIPLSPATPLSPLQACTSHRSPPPSAGGNSGQKSPRSPSIVFPISPNPSISRAREFQKALDTPRCQTAFQHIRSITNPSTADSIRELITSTERSRMPDETLLEEVARRLGLVDYEKARSVGGRDAEDADIVLAEEGYAEKWEAFADLCKSLGVGAYELSMAKRRCGPAIDLCGQRSPEVRGANSVV